MAKKKLFRNQVPSNCGGGAVFFVSEGIFLEDYLSWVYEVWEWMCRVCFDSLAHGNCGCNLKSIILKFISRMDILRFPVKLCSGECHKTSLMVSQHLSR